MRNKLCDKTWLRSTPKNLPPREYRVKLKNITCHYDENNEVIFCFKIVMEEEDES